MQIAKINWPHHSSFDVDRAEEIIEACKQAVRDAYVLPVAETKDAPYFSADTEPEYAWVEGWDAYREKLIEVVQ